MKIIILGAGHVGYSLAKQLSFDEHDVSIIDHDDKTLKKISEKLDVRSVIGNAVDVETLKEAGGNDADIIIAATSSDEVNIVACQIAGFMFGVETKIARLSNKSYFINNELFGKNKFTIDLIASPEIEISSVIKRSISVYGALDVIPCVDDKLLIVGIQCTKNSAFANVPVKFVANISNNISIAILFIERNGISFLPTKTDVIMNEDNVYLVIKNEDLNAIMSLFGYTENRNNNIIIIGGGVIGEEIAKSLHDDNSDTVVKIIERDMDRAEDLSETLENVEIFYGDALDPEVLSAALISEAGVTLAVTNNDKVNILSCLLARKYGAKRVAAMISDVSNISLLYTLGINTILDSKKAVVSKILHYIKKGGVDNIFTFADDSIEMLSINVMDNSRAIGILTENIGSDNQLAVAALVRKDKVYMTPKRMVINAGDKILFVAKKEAVVKIITLFKEKPKYLT